MADISKITLPSGTTYDIKDAVARSLISAGVTFIVAWDGASAPVAADIPAGVVVTYNGTSTTGTLAPADGVAGAFYLIKSSTNPTSETLDIYDEYVVVKPVTSDDTTWFWEKIGDTQINLTDVVTDVTLNKQTDSVIGADSTFKITQPTIALATGATAGTGVISVATGITSATATGDNVTALTGLGTPSTKSAIGANSTFTITQPTINLTANTDTATGRITYVQSQGTAQTTKLSATAADGSTAWNSKDAKTVVTGYASPTTDTFVKSVTPSTSKLTTTTVTGVSGSTTASKATAATSQTTVSGSASSTSNADFLANVSVSNEVLTIGAKKLNTQTTTQFTFADVTVPKAAVSATTVATGAVASGSTGASVVTGVSTGGSADAITGLGSPSTASVIGVNSTFTNTQPTITVASGTTGDVTVATGIGAATTRYLSADATGANTAWNSKDAVSAVTGYANTTSDEVLGSGSTITVTPTTTNIKATATGAKTEWDNKDAVAALTNGTTLNVTKGS